MKRESADDSYELLSALERRSAQVHPDLDLLGLDL